MLYDPELLISRELRIVMLYAHEMLDSSCRPTCSGAACLRLTKYGGLLAVSNQSCW